LILVYNIFILSTLSEEALSENGALFEPLGVSGWNVKATLCVVAFVDLIGDSLEEIP
jgi:hypothetical protein